MAEDNVRTIKTNAPAMPVVSHIRIDTLLMAAQYWLLVRKDSETAAFILRRAITAMPDHWCDADAKLSGLVSEADHRQTYVALLSLPKAPEGCE